MGKTTSRLKSFFVAVMAFWAFSQTIYANTKKNLPEQLELDLPQSYSSVFEKPELFDPFQVVGSQGWNYISEMIAASGNLDYNPYTRTLSINGSDAITYKFGEGIEYANKNIEKFLEFDIGKLDETKTEILVDILVQVSKGVSIPDIQNNLKDIIEEYYKGIDIPVIPENEGSPLPEDPLDDIAEKVLELEKTFLDLLDGASQIESLFDKTQGKDYLKYTLDLSLEAALKTKFLASQDFSSFGSNLGIYRGLDVQAVSNKAIAKFNLNFNWGGKIDLMDLAQQSLTGKINGSINGDLLIDYNYDLTFKDYLQFVSDSKKNSSFSIGVVRIFSQSEEYTSTGSFSLDVKVNADSQTASINSKKVEEESRLTTTESSQIVFTMHQFGNMRTFGGFNFMQGVIETDISETFSYKRKATIDSTEGGLTQESTSLEKKIRKSEHDYIYGWSFLRRFNDSFSFYGAGTNYSELRNDAGIIYNSNMISTMFGPSSGELFLKLQGGSSEPFLRYYENRVDNLINTLQEYIDFKSYSDLSGEIQSLVLTLSSKDKLHKMGFIAPFGFRSHLEAGLTREMGYKKGHYVNIVLPGVEVLASSQEFTKDGITGGERSLGLRFVGEDTMYSLDVHSPNVHSQNSPQQAGFTLYINGKF